MISGAYKAPFQTVASRMISNPPIRAETIRVLLGTGNCRLPLALKNRIRPTDYGASPIGHVCDLRYFDKELTIRLEDIQYYRPTTRSFFSYAIGTKLAIICAGPLILKNEHESRRISPYPLAYAWTAGLFSAQHDWMMVALTQLRLE